MWNSQTRRDLIIEVWEKLDCESVGATEIEAITIVVRDTLGDSAALNPMRIARLLADEGAVLRHSEIMKLFVGQNRLDEGEFRGLLNFEDIQSALVSIRALEKLRKRYLDEGNREAIRNLSKLASDARRQQKEIAGSEVRDNRSRMISSEITEWLAIWLNSPEVFDGWVTMRMKSDGFRENFGEED